MFQMLVYVFAFSLLWSAVSGGCRTTGDILKSVIPFMTLFCQAANQSLKLPLSEDMQPFFGNGHLGDGGSSSVCVWRCAQACKETRGTTMNQSGILSSPWPCLQRCICSLYAQQFLKDFYSRNLPSFLLSLGKHLANTFFNLLVKLWNENVGKSWFFCCFTFSEHPPIIRKKTSKMPKP